MKRLLGFTARTPRIVVSSGNGNTLESSAQVMAGVDLHTVAQLIRHQMQSTKVAELADAPDLGTESAIFQNIEVIELTST